MNKYVFNLMALIPLIAFNNYDFYFENVKDRESIVNVKRDISNNEADIINREADIISITALIIELDDDITVEQFYDQYKNIIIKIKLGSNINSDNFDSNNYKILWNYSIQELNNLSPIKKVLGRSNSKFIIPIHKSILSGFVMIAIQHCTLTLIVDTNQKFKSLCVLYEHIYVQQEKRMYLANIDQYGLYKYGGGYMF